MRRVLGALAAVVVLASSAWPGETGFIQIKCAPGVQIFLDGNLKGITNAEVGGLILQDVAPGQHEIKAIRQGFNPQVEAISVKAGEVVAFEVKPFVPKVEIREEGQERGTEVKLKVGSLQIQSVPIECKLTIAGLGVNGQAKTKDRWQAQGVPVGKYTVVAEAMGKRLEREVEVYESFNSELLINFVAGEVKDVGSERRVADQAAAKLREAELDKVRAEAKKQGIELPAGWAFVPIKPGSFTMGSPPGETGRQDHEKQHKVKLSRAFWMSAYETTQAQYEELMGRNPSNFKGPKRPVEMVSWDDAQDFIRKLNERERQAGRLPKDWAYRLPTEAEWEYACRAGADTAYCLGNGAGPLDDYGWHSGNSGNQTHDVAQKRANAWGLYDMHGNVWEWCADRHGDYEVGEQTDPSGPANGESRVVRGGAWVNSPTALRSAIRDRFTPGYRDIYFGFRVVLAPGPR